MKVDIFGLGYVGCVMAACLANDGNHVVGIDINPLKVEMINAGQSPIIEPGLADMIRQGRQSGKLSADMDARAVVLESDISLICVGTPSNDNGSLRLDYVDNVCRQIGEALREKDSYHVVVVRSTVLPGTVEERLIPILERASGRKAGVDFGVCMNPEFLREGSAIKDYYHPGILVIGELDQRSGDLLAPLYEPIEVPLTRTAIRTAEMVKYTCNAFHALKVVFGNEIGTLAKANGVDGQEVMDIICQDKQLNISTAYLRPGYAFGGSCLPKDLRAILYRAKELDVELPMLGTLLQSNHQHVEMSIKMVERIGKHKIGVLGLSFKAETDDVRESPVITLIETLIGRGYQVRIYDEKIQLARLVGANKAFLEKGIPHITTLMCATMEELIDQSEVLVVANSAAEFRQIGEKMKPGQFLIDLVGIAKAAGSQIENYEGICW
ncbi:MAG TPA: UDP-glucose/GDP-mannose dehydrogenase family protein [Chloroflexi bacterium]|mgnify:CR=1 FL=1|nr:UDP-glucose/GDP-mannose dehydrogenase family protein [Chloroflexota bacterium]